MLQRYELLKHKEAFSTTQRQDFAAACSELAYLARKGFQSSPKVLQAKIFEAFVSAIDAYQSHEPPSTPCETDAIRSLVLSAAAAHMPHQKLAQLQSSLKKALMQQARVKKRRDARGWKPSAQGDEDEGEQGHVSITDLPKDVLRQVFADLETAGLACCARVCKSWKEIVYGHEAAWESKFASTFPAKCYQHARARLLQNAGAELPQRAHTSTGPHVSLSWQDNGQGGGTQGGDLGTAARANAFPPSTSVASIASATVNRACGTISTPGSPRSCPVNPAHTQQAGSSLPGVASEGPDAHEPTGLASGGNSTSADRAHQPSHLLAKEHERARSRMLPPAIGNHGSMAVDRRPPHQQRAGSGGWGFDKGDAVAGREDKRHNHGQPAGDCGSSYGQVEGQAAPASPDRSWMPSFAATRKAATRSTGAATRGATECGGSAAASTGGLDKGGGFFVPGSAVMAGDASDEEGSDGVEGGSGCERLTGGATWSSWREAFALFARAYPQLAVASGHRRCHTCVGAVFWMGSADAQKHERHKQSRPMSAEEVYAFVFGGT
eukprot:jgi/Mesvir1/1076/Mv17591-RA.1